MAPLTLALTLTFHTLMRWLRVLQVLVKASSKLRLDEDHKLTKRLRDDVKVWCILSPF